MCQCSLMACIFYDAASSRNLGSKSTLRKLQVNLGDPNTDIPSVGSGRHAAKCEDKRHHDCFCTQLEII